MSIDQMPPMGGAVSDNRQLSVQERMTQRKQLLWGFLCGNVGKEFPFETLAEVLKAVYNDSVKPSAIQQTLGVMKQSPCPLRGGILTIGKTRAHLDCHQTVADQRERHRPQVKYLLGAAVWKILFDVDALKKGEERPHVDWYRRKRIERRIEELRNQALCRMLIDAGSTTFCVAQTYNRLDGMPLSVKVPFGDSLRRSLVRFNFLSNSVKIMEELRCGRHCLNTGLTVVGGDIRGDRGSVCGSAAEAFLRECTTGGDVAIIGTTGFGGLDGGRRTFYADTLDEACVKTSFLQRSWLRIALFDSSKLVTKSAGLVFADLSPETIDLVITDDGHDFEGTEDYTAAVQAFCRHAEENDLPVALVSKTK